jgi:hypothetical protein
MNTKLNTICIYSGFLNQQSVFTSFPKNHQVNTNVFLMTCIQFAICFRADNPSQQAVIEFALNLLAFYFEN